jgi:branched-subunit amino acid transport protein
MTTWAKRGFRLPVDRLTLSATLVSTLSPVPSSVCAALVDPNWHHTMEEEFAALIANNI